MHIHSAAAQQKFRHYYGLLILKNYQPCIANQLWNFIANKLRACTHISARLCTEFQSHTSSFHFVDMIWKTDLSYAKRCIFQCWKIAANHFQARCYEEWNRHLRVGNLKFTFWNKKLLPSTPRPYSNLHVCRTLLRSWIRKSNILFDA